MKKIKSPLNYIGGKYKLLEQILPLFPKDINTFVDLFSGGGNIGININAKNIIFNDNLTYLIDLFKELQSKDIEYTIHYIEKMIKKYNLSKTNEEGYKKFRDYYNSTKYSLDLFILVAYSFNHQIRFNNNHKFNNPFGRNRSSFNNSMKLNLKKFILELKSKNIEFQNLSFETFNFSELTKNDFVYCDPPYLITTGSYNDGKRGFKGWSEKEEIELLDLLRSLDENGIRFALSNVIYHKGKENIILKEWLNNNNFNLNYLKKNYSNSNYHTKIREKNGSLEVLITNYIQPKLLQPKLFNF
ncbi:MAG: DNA adenine methylase [Tenericutes bacterium 4572_104]|nr:MAG: DNA adenine methylase [Tenericutes bacterium 4572_104]